MSRCVPLTRLRIRRPPDWRTAGLRWTNWQPNRWGHYLIHSVRWPPVAAWWALTGVLPCGYVMVCFTPCPATHTYTHARRLLELVSYRSHLSYSAFGCYPTHITLTHIYVCPQDARVREFEEWMSQQSAALKQSQAKIEAEERRYVCVYVPFKQSITVYR